MPSESIFLEDIVCILELLQEGNCEILPEARFFPEQNDIRRSDDAWIYNRNVVKRMKREKKQG